MNTRAVVLRRLLMVASAITVTASLAAAESPHVTTTDAGSPPDPSLSVRELPFVPVELASTLSSPDVTAALGGPADPARAKAVELGPEHVQAVWAPSVTEPGAGVAVARAPSGELRVVTVRPQGGGALLLGAGGDTFQVRLQSSTEGLHIDVAPTAQRSGTAAFSWDCFASCFVERAAACAVSCGDCAYSGFTACGPCVDCLGLWGVYCAMRC